MEDNKDQAKPQADSQSKGSVMDIQPPKPQPAAPAAPTPEPTPLPAEPATPPAPTEEAPTPDAYGAPSTPSAPVGAPSDPSSIALVKEEAPANAEETPAKKPGLSAELLAQAQKETKKPAADPKQPLLAAHGSHKKGPKLAIFIAIIVALALSGVAVWAYMASQKDKTPPAHDTSHDTSSQQETDDHDMAEPATTSEVDTTTKEVDDAMNGADEAQDLPDDINEDTVGL